MFGDYFLTITVLLSSAKVTSYFPPVPCRQAAGPVHRGPEEAEGEGPEEDPGGVGRVLQRLRRKVRLHPQNHRAHAPVRPGGGQSTDRAVTGSQKRSNTIWTPPGRFLFLWALFACWAEPDLVNPD